MLMVDAEARNRTTAAARAGASVTQDGKTPGNARPNAASAGTSPQTAAANANAGQSTPAANGNSPGGNTQDDTSDDDDEPSKEKLAQDAAKQAPLGDGKKLFSSQFTGDSKNAADPDAAKSQEWMEALSDEEQEDLKIRIGPEVYDAECSDHIRDTLAEERAGDDWWLDTLTEEPLVAGYMDPKTAEERDKMYEDAVDASSSKFGKVLKKLMNGLKKAFHGVKDFFRGKWNRKAIAKFKAKIAAIKGKEKDKDGKVATVCSLDTSTLKLLPMSRHFHKALHEKDRERNPQNPKCSVNGDKSKGDWAKSLNGRRLVGGMDVDRVMRATQMAIFRLCHYKCVTFIAENFEKMIMTENNPEGTFCKMSYSKQQEHIMGRGIDKGGPEKFLKQLIDSTESGNYDQCEILFAEKDTAPELIDYAVELACHPYPRPTPSYVPSENPPAELYNQKSDDNEPVCKPERDDYEAHSENSRNCPEGSVCHCQRNAVTKKTGKLAKIFDPRHWGEVEHCTAKRNTGQKALLWIDATKMYLSKWQQRMETFRKTRGGTKVGIALIMGGALYYSIFLLMMVKWSAVAAFSGGAAGAGGLGGGGAVGGAAILTALTGPFGPGIIIGILAFSAITWSATFSCAENMGCYPMKCIFDKKMEGKGACRLKFPKDSAERRLEGNPLWYLPPAGMSCAYTGGFGAAVGITLESQCRLKPCPPERQAKGLVGYYEGHKKRLSFGNCQPLGVKDMNEAQQQKLFETLRGDKIVEKMVDRAKQLSKVPECLADSNCRTGTRPANPLAMPQCIKMQCRRPLLTSMEVHVHYPEGQEKSADDESWQEPFKRTIIKKALKDRVQIDGKPTITIIQEKPEAAVDEEGGEEEKSLVELIGRDKIDGKPAITVIQEKPEAAVEEEGEGGEAEASLVGLIAAVEEAAVEEAAVEEEGEAEEASLIELIGIESNAAQGTLLVMPDEVRKNFPSQGSGANSSALLERRDNVTLRSLLRSSNGAGSGITVSNAFLQGNDCDPPRCQVKKVQVTIITFEDQKTMQALRKVQEGDALVDRKDKSATFTVAQLGRNCEARELPEHSANACDQTPDGGMCELTCSPGWVQENSIVCRDGIWSDEMPIEEGRQQDVFQCVDAACPIARNVPDCPRNTLGCWEWEDSACERGGLSGSQNTCVVKPTDGYRLVDTNVHTVKCLDSGQWEWPKRKDGTHPIPELEDEECDPSEAADMYDKETVESICRSAFSGKGSVDADAGSCPLKCKHGLVDDPATAGDQLKCTLTGWTGHAKCVEPPPEPEEDLEEMEWDEDDEHGHGAAGMKGKRSNGKESSAISISVAAMVLVLGAAH